MGTDKGRPRHSSRFQVSKSSKSGSQTCVGQRPGCVGLGVGLHVLEFSGVEKLKQRAPNLSGSRTGCVGLHVLGVSRVDKVKKRAPNRPGCVGLGGREPTSGSQPVWVKAGLRGVGRAGAHVLEFSGVEKLKASEAAPMGDFIIWNDDFRVGTGCQACNV